MPAYPLDSFPGSTHVVGQIRHVAAIIKAGLVGLLVFGFVAPAPAQTMEKTPKKPEPASNPALKAVLTQVKVIKVEGGGEKFEDASRVRPGDILEYRVAYTNTSGKSLTGLVARLPIPEGLAYQANSAKPSEFPAQAATGNGLFSAEPLSRTVGGKTLPIPYAEYRQLRWNVGQLSAGGSATVTARAQVEQVVPIIVRPVADVPANADPNSATPKP